MIKREAFFVSLFTKRISIRTVIAELHLPHAHYQRVPVEKRNGKYLYLLIRGRIITLVLVRRNKSLGVRDSGRRSNGQPVDSLTDGHRLKGRIIKKPQFSVNVIKRNRPWKLSFNAKWQTMTACMHAARHHAVDQLNGRPQHNNSGSVHSWFHCTEHQFCTLYLHCSLRARFCPSLQDNCDLSHHTAPWSGLRHKYIRFFSVSVPHIHLYTH